MGTGGEMRLVPSIPDGYEVARYQKGGEFAEAWPAGPPEARERPRCGAKGHADGHRPRTVSRLPVQDRPLVPRLDVAQMRCPECGKCWPDGHSMVSEASPHISRDPGAAILRHIMTRHTVTDASRRYGAGPHIRGRVPGAAMPGHGYLPGQPCIDELEADTPEGRFATVVVDGGSGCLVEVLPGKRAEHLDEFFSHFDGRERSRVRWYCCDMCDAHVSAAKGRPPGAEARTGRSRVARRAVRAVGDVRRRPRNDEPTTKAQARLLRSCWKPMPVRREDAESLDDACAAELAERRARFESALAWDGDLNDLPDMRAREPLCGKLERALGTDGGLRLAYDLLQAFYRWSDEPRTKRKRDGLGRRMALAEPAGVPGTGAGSDTLRAYRGGILNGYRHGRTNAQAEGTNNAIKVIERTSYGFRDFARMRRRLMLALGYHRIIEGHVTLRDVAAGTGKCRR